MARGHNGGFFNDLITNLDGDAIEIKATISREEATNKRFGFLLFNNGKDANSGFPVVINPVTESIRVGKIEAPFLVEDLPEGEDVELRIFIDKYLVEVFVNNKQAALGVCMDYAQNSGLYGYTYGTSTLFKEINIWKLKPTNQGYFTAKENRIWEPSTK